MSKAKVERQIERSRKRLARLRKEAERGGRGSDPLLQQAVEELGHALEELSVSLEELSSTNEELAEAQITAEEHARRYLDLFRSAPDAYVVTDERGVIREVNATAEEKLGRSGRYLAGKPLLSLVGAPDRDAFLSCLAVLRERRGRLEDRLLRFGGGQGFDASVGALPEQRGEGVEIRWILRDVTERRKAEAALRASEARMRSLAQSLRVLIAYTDRDGRYRFANAAYQEWFGLPPEKVVGMPERELLGEVAWAQLQPRIQGVLAGRPQLFEERVAYARGGTRDVMSEYEPDLREDGEVAGYYSLVVDVSDVKRAEREAREAEARVRLVLDAALDGMLVVDETGRIQLVNQSLCRMLGYEAQDLLGRPASGLLGATPGGGGPALESMVGSVQERVGIRKDGTHLPVEISVGEARLADGPTFVASVRDLSERKTLQSELRAAAAATVLAEERERRRLASDLHDGLGQLLTLAGMKLGALRKEGGDPALEAPLAEVAELVSRAHSRIESLVFQLSPPILHDVGLAAAAEWLAEEMERSYGLRVHVEHGAEPPLDEESRVTLFRALRELLINVARHARTEQAWVRLGLDAGCLQLVVEDRGVGFDPALEPRGYGLFSIRERLRYLGGRFAIEAVPGDGTRVTLVAPLAGSDVRGGARSLSRGSSRGA